MELIDVTRPIHPGMAVYPGDPGTQLELVAALAAGDDANVTRIDMSAHAGTHVDAPRHYVDGERSVDELPLEALVGEAAVVDAELPDVPRLLFRGGRELTAEEAAALVERGVRLVGTEGMTIGNDDVHRTLLAAGIVILEGLDLSAAESGRYELLCLPLKLAGADGAPARVLLRR
jgi:arylformamidase